VLHLSPRLAPKVMPPRKSRLTRGALQNAISGSFLRVGLWMAAPDMAPKY
jgi:hypothetical protein